MMSAMLMLDLRLSERLKGILTIVSVKIEQDVLGVMTLVWLKLFIRLFPLGIFWVVSSCIVRAL